MFDSYFSKTKKKHTYNAFVSLFIYFFLNNLIHGITEITSLVVFYNKHVSPDKKGVIACQFAKCNPQGKNYSVKTKHTLYIYIYILVTQGVRASLHAP